MMSAIVEIPPTRENFAAVGESHRKVLRRHCYRMLGSLHEADDLVQETLLRAWRGLDGFSGGSFRAWLYRIATNACLDELARRGATRRWLPDQHDPDHSGEPGPTCDVPWLEPLPESEDVADESPGPEARFAEREAVRLAFIAAIQELPPRPRAALLLCDVLGWKAVQAAAALDTTLPALNSGLQRARETLTRRYRQGRPDDAPRPTQAQSALLGRYLSAWENHDIDALVATLRDDATCVMPPWRMWFSGRAAIGPFFAQAWTTCPGLRLVATVANGQPAFAVYQRAPDGLFFANALHVLTVEGEAIGGMTLFLEDSGRLFEAFGLPKSIAAAQ